MRWRKKKPKGKCKRSHNPHIVFVVCWRISDTYTLIPTSPLFFIILSSVALYIILKDLRLKNPYYFVFSRNIKRSICCENVRIVYSKNWNCITFTRNTSFQLTIYVIKFTEVLLYKEGQVDICVSSMI